MSKMQIIIFCLNLGVYINVFILESYKMNMTEYSELEGINKDHLITK